ncbi:MULTISPECIES: MarR family winged helix-turn-helix transcriptional regulator [unclassified Sphingobium]|uniref:MarR family winged helix-turn-helix transcriptional regulator n=1 Tax=unclassified Sphingobium TaxID=2611147 RepID=UPI0035A741FE
MTDKVLKLEAFLPYRLSYTAALLSELVTNAYRSTFGLTIPEWRVLAHVAERPGISQQEVGHRSRMDKVTVSRAATALHGKGLLQRDASADDRRVLNLRLSPAGRSLFDRIAPVALDLERRIAGSLSPDEIDRLRDLLGRIDAAALWQIGGMKGYTKVR